jgi:hypothetical protein
MRILLILLVLAVPAVLVLPTFWAVVSIWFGAHPVTYIERDGRVQPAVLGPKAKWPDWALTPEGSKLTVSAWFAASPPQPEMGFGELKDIAGAPRAVVAAYIGKLRAEGWQVEAVEQETVEPSIPPKPYKACDIRATRPGDDTRIIQARIALEAVPRPGSIHWWNAAPPHAWPKAEGRAC